MGGLGSGRNKRNWVGEECRKKKEKGSEGKEQNERGEGGGRRGRIKSLRLTASPEASTLDCLDTLEVEPERSKTERGSDGPVLERTAFLCWRGKIWIRHYIALYIFCRVCFFPF
jgi:hypothetical protein